MIDGQHFVLLNAVFCDIPRIVPCTSFVTFGATSLSGFGYRLMT